MSLTAHDNFDPKNFEDLNAVLDLTCRTLESSTEGSGIPANSLITQLSSALAATIYEIDKLQSRVAKLESNDQ